MNYSICPIANWETCQLEMFEGQFILRFTTKWFSLHPPSSRECQLHCFSCIHAGRDCSFVKTGLDLLDAALTQAAIVIRLSLQLFPPIFSKKEVECRSLVTWSQKRFDLGLNATSVQRWTEVCIWYDHI